MTSSRISFVGVGHATSLLLAITFVLCVGFDILFPAYAMHEAWQKLLPGFQWLNWENFLLGLVEAYIYGWYVAVIWAPLYNLFASRDKAEGGNTL